MKLSYGLTKALPTGGMVVCYLLSIGLLALALKAIDVSVAYAIWSGLGTALITVVGVILFRESMPIQKVVGIFFVITGIVLLNLAQRTG